LFAGVGNHTIIYLITGACGNSDTISLTVLPSPTAYATATDESCINKADGSATVSGSGGTAPYTFLWETSETTGNISGLTPGQYSVILTDANGCQDVDTVNVLAATSSCETVIPVVYVPNIFTPNGDGNNDVLFVRGQGITEFSLRIYDRWGEKVFETTDLSQGWNGKFRGKDVDQGVFVYTLYVLFADGSETKDKGNITMTR
jgi:gliding motility-associated-like protein